MMTRLHSPAFPLLSDFAIADGHEIKRDYEAELKTAYDDGYQQGLIDGRAEAQADAEFRLVEAQTVFQSQRDDERLAFQRDCADVLAERFNSAVKLIERSIEDRIAMLLRPWLIEQIRERALLDLEKAIGRALADGAKVHIEAPEEILTHFRERLPTGAFQIGYSESQTPDIRAHIEDTEIEANISDWIANLEAAVT